MMPVEIAHITLDEFKGNLLPDWLGETSPELFREYLSISSEVRSSLLSDRFFRLYERSDSDIRACKRGGEYLSIMGIEHLDWDSRHFGVECGKISPYCLSGKLTRGDQEEVHRLMLAYGIEWARRKNIKILQRRLLSSRLHEINVLEDVGFHLADNVVTLAAPVNNVLLATQNKERPELIFRHPANHELASLKSMTHGAFSCSRFVNDKILPSNLGDDLYMRWITRLFEESISNGGDASNGNGMLVAQLEDRIAGYVAYQVDPILPAGWSERIASIELIVVDSEFQGKGLGQCLFRAAAKAVSGLGAGFLESTTWINHRISMESNQKAGLRVCENLFTYHCYL